MLGPEHSKQFVKKYYWICGKPLDLCIVGVSCMMLSQLPFLATTYHMWVFWSGIVLLFAFVVAMVYSYVLLRRETIALVNERKEDSALSVHLSLAGNAVVATDENDPESGIKAE